MKASLLIICAAFALTGCVTQPQKKDFTAFNAAKPRSILVVPIINKSLDVDAPNYMLSTLPVPLAERGYYVFPVNTSKMVLEQEGFYEGEQIAQQSPEALTKLFGADAVLFVTINRWDAQYAFIATTVTVDFDYRMVAKDGTEIWTDKQKLVYSPQQQNSGSPIAMLVAAAINAAIARAVPNYMPLARQANDTALLTGPQPLPAGPYAAVKP